MEENSRELFWQIRQILLQNEEEVRQIETDHEKSCFITAKAAAYIIENNPDVITNQEELKKITEFLQIDELHFFDPDGNLYAGSEPKYFGLNFASGEQMAFFLPMLKDQSLELCQDITPNTAEEKLMQYAAVWREDGKGIVQIGMEPARVLEAMKKNELSYIFSLVTADSSAVICAVDPETYEVLGATKEKYVGKNAEDLGLDAAQLTKGESGFHTGFDGQKSYCVAAVSESVIFVRICADEYLLQPVNTTSLMLAVYMLLMSAVMIMAISRYLERYIIRDIFAVNRDLRLITEGNLDVHVDVDTTPEFAELSSQLNLMIGSILDSTNKLSRVLDYVTIPVAVYEYRGNMKRVMATRRIGEILELSGREIESLLENYELFEKKLEELKAYPVDMEKGIYRMPGKERHFIRIESIFYENITLGIIMDVTEEENEKYRIRQERDIDLLTGLFSRRAFYRFMEEIFRPQPDFLHGMILLADADGLKQVNDRYGHEDGDRYLCSIASVLRSCPAPKRIVGRLGGDEFVLLLYNDAGTGEMLKYVEYIREAREREAVELSTQEIIPVRFSLGYAFYPDDGEDYHELIRIADERMYQEKKEHRHLS